MMLIYFYAFALVYIILAIAYLWQPWRWIRRFFYGHDLESPQASFLSVDPAASNLDQTQSIEPEASAVPHIKDDVLSSAQSLRDEPTDASWYSEPKDDSFYLHRLLKPLKAWFYGSDDRLMNDDAPMRPRYPHRHDYLDVAPSADTVVVAASRYTDSEGHSDVSIGAPDDTMDAPELRHASASEPTLSLDGLSRDTWPNDDPSDLAPMVDRLWQPWSMTQNTRDLEEPLTPRPTATEGTYTHRNLTAVDDDELLRQYEAIVAQNLQKEASIRVSMDREGQRLGLHCDALDRDSEATPRQEQNHDLHQKADHGFRRAPLDPARYEQQIMANLKRLELRRAQEHHDLVGEEAPEPVVPLSYPAHLLFKQGQLDQSEASAYAEVSEEERRARLRQQLAGRRPPPSAQASDSYVIRPLAAIAQPNPSPKTTSPLFYTPIDPPMPPEEAEAIQKVAPPTIDLPVFDVAMVHTADQLKTKPSVQLRWGGALLATPAPVIVTHATASAQPEDARVIDSAPLPERHSLLSDNTFVHSDRPNLVPQSQEEAIIHTPERPMANPTVAVHHAPVNTNTLYRLPHLDLLRPADALKPSQTEDELIERGIIIEEKLAEFKVKVRVLDAYAGPIITRYEIEPAVGIRGSQIINLTKDLSRALGLASIRVVETIPGKTCMGLELPNPIRQMIRFSEVIASEAFVNHPSKLIMAMGKDITGEPVVADLAKMPHLLVAGTTGSGKSVGVNAMILSLLYKARPDEVRFIMIDPKMLELSIYNDIPHLLAPVVTDMKLAANALNWCVAEMERRYQLLSAMGVRNLAGFNEKIQLAQQQGRKLPHPFSLTPEAPEPLETLPFIVVVVDEFADLMMTAGKKIEELIARIAQKARAAGIHLILATQRPSVDVITGLIKANIPTRMAFQVSSKIDSRTILDQMGAESLLGQGDMLFLPPGSGYPQRIHGAFVTDEEVHAIVDYIKSFGEPNYVEGLLAGEREANDEPKDNVSLDEAEDPLYNDAVAYVLKSGRASTSGIQRYLRVGYNRAARIVDQMEHEGLVSAPERNGNRTILVQTRSAIEPLDDDALMA